MGVNGDIGDRLAGLGDALNKGKTPSDSAWKAFKNDTQPAASIETATLSENSLRAKLLAVQAQLKGLSDPQNVSLADSL